MKRLLYEGGWINGNYAGPGVRFLEDGSSLEGLFINGVVEGWGKLETPKGESYEGEFVKGLYEGRGTWKQEGIAVYSGHFRANKKEDCTGNATLLELNGRLGTLTGKWVNDVLQGIATYCPGPQSRTGANAAVVSEQRHYLDGTLHGKLLITFSDDVICTREYERGVLQSQAVRGDD